MRRRAAALFAPLLLLTACAESGEDPEPVQTTSTTAAAPSGDAPTVTGAFGEEPTVELPAGDAGSDLVVEVLEKGDGVVVGDGELVVADFYGQRWAADRKAPASTDEASSNPTDSANPGEPAGDAVLESTFDGGTPQSFTLAEGNVLPGWYEGLVGQTVGSRVLLVMPPEAGFGAEGNPSFGIGADDSMVFVFDLLDAFEADAAAEGAPVDLAPDPALPTVAEGDNGPTVTVPAGIAAPTELVAQTLIEGPGDEVVSGQHLVVQYRGVLWKDGSEFDASWTTGMPTGFPIGVGGVIPGWDIGLVGRTVGSQVLLVVPPADGYGSEGRPPSISGDDTLVFVVDILGAYGEPQV